MKIYAKVQTKEEQLNTLLNKFHSSDYKTNIEHGSWNIIILGLNTPYRYQVTYYHPPVPGYNITLKSSTSSNYAYKHEMAFNTIMREFFGFGLYK